MSSFFKTPFSTKITNFYQICKMYENASHTGLLNLFQDRVPAPFEPLNSMKYYWEYHIFCWVKLSFLLLGIIRFPWLLTFLKIFRLLQSFKFQDFSRFFHDRTNPEWRVCTNLVVIYIYSAIKQNTCTFCSTLPFLSHLSTNNGQLTPSDFHTPPVEDFDITPEYLHTIHF